MGISGFNTPMKDVSAPVIVTADGVQKVHADAVTQAPASVSDTIVTGDVDPDATQIGTHTNASDKIINSGQRIEDNPTREEGITSVSDIIVTGDIAAGASQTGTHTLTGDSIVNDAHRIADNPTREEGVTSVTEHVISGDVASGATDDGALQSPSLPVEVTSGNLGPNAAYNSPNRTLNIIDTAIKGTDLLAEFYDTDFNYSNAQVPCFFIVLSTDGPGVSQISGPTGDIQLLGSYDTAFSAKIIGTGSWSVNVYLDDSGNRECALVSVSEY